MATADDKAAVASDAADGTSYAFVYGEFSYIFIYCIILLLLTSPGTLVSQSKLDATCWFTR